MQLEAQLFKCLLVLQWLSDTERRMQFTHRKGKLSTLGGKERCLSPPKRGTGIDMVHTQICGFYSSTFSRTIEDHFQGLSRSILFHEIDA